MANTTKTYTISIQLSAAQQALTDTSKKLAALDAQLNGLDQDSDAAKAITAEMAKLAKQVEGLNGEVDGFASRLDGLKAGTPAALRAEVEALGAAFEHLEIGTKEYEAALLDLAGKRGELNKLENSLDALNEEARSGAVADLAAGMAGVVGVGLAASEALGLSASSAAEYEQKMQTVLTVVSSFEAISKALSAESRTNVKNLLATAKAYLTGGEAATTGGKAARLAIAGTGIGLLVIALAYVVTNWEKLTKTVVGSEGAFTRFKAVVSGLFDGLIASVKVGAQAVTQFVTGDFGGLAVTMKGAGKRIGDAYNQGYQESLFEGYKKTIEQQITYNEQILKIQQASGRSSYDLERKILLDKFVLLDKHASDYKQKYTELLGDLAALDRTEQVKQKKAALDAAQARLDGVAALEAAKGNDAFRQQLSAKKSQLAALQAAAQPDAAAIINKQSEIDTLTTQHEQQLAEKRRAALLARQQAEIALLEVQGKYTLDLKVRQAQELLALDTGTSEKALEQKKADNTALQLLLEQQAQFEKDLGQKRFEDRQDEQGAAVEQANAFQAVIKDSGKELAQRATDLEKSIRGDLGRTLLTKLFGVKPEDVEAVKQALTQAVSEVYGSLQGLATAYLDGALQEADRQVQAAQERLAQLDQQLNDSRSAAQQTEQQLAESSGARRDYLLQKLTKERAETERLAAAQKKAAQDEAAATREKHRLEKESAKIMAASALATNVATAASAVYAGVKAVEKGSEAGPFPANLIAIAASIAAVIAAVASAKQLSNAATYADGGLVGGPSHAQGGVQLFHRGGAHLGEMEGGEHITNRQATAHNLGWLDFINTAGRARALTPLDFAQLSVPYEIIPPPAGYYPGHYANGGVLPEAGGAGGSAAASAASVESLRADVQQTNALLQRMLQHTASTAATNRFIAEKPPMVPDAQTALKYRELAQQVDTAEAMVTL